MGFIRRLLGGGRSSDIASNPTSDAIDAADPVAPADRTSPVDLDAAERAYELEVLREEQARLDDLAQRQLKYARYAWQPPSQGGERRADDSDDAP
jgi:hypothetical protein